MPISGFAASPFPVIPTKSCAWRPGTQLCSWSPSVLADARRYLTLLFPEHLPKLDGFLATALTETMADLAPEEVVNHRDLVRDLKDVPVVMAATAAGVDFLISIDAYPTDAKENTAALRQLVAPGRVMRPGAFLSDIIGGP